MATSIVKRATPKAIADWAKKAEVFFGGIGVSMAPLWSAGPAPHIGTDTHLRARRWCHTAACDLLVVACRGRGPGRSLPRTRRAARDRAGQRRRPGRLPGRQLRAPGGGSVVRRGDGAVDRLRHLGVRRLTAPYPPAPRCRPGD